MLARFNSRPVSERFPQLPTWRSRPLKIDGVCIMAKLGARFTRGIIRMETRSRFSMTASLAALVILTMLTAAASAQAQNTVGTITQITGAATVQRTGATIG